MTVRDRERDGTSGGPGMKIAAIQHDIAFEDAVATRAHVAPMIAEAAAANARVIVLTEMFATGFSMSPERIAEDEGGPSEQFLIDQACQNKAWLIASIAQRGGDGRYRNNAVVAGPDGSVHRYSKIHPFSYAHEDEHYAAGTKHLTVDIDGLRATVFVCYDLRFADEFWESALGTDLYVVPATERANGRVAGDREPGVCGRGQPGRRRQGCPAPRRFSHHRPARAHAGRGERRRGRAGRRGLG
jgi:predicted amidohydrolase